ncbi:hypothetical protein GND95_08705 [Defluviitalea raffinosedens]|uniref:Uncharacterized protein n=1 Tax=Defluviitalea raffinosedens TaxID=1450156 RepID=A0A7C8HED6_9FIRM|nr:hypothetical protein GND95_08705 [Defluviitalea raffinosedens]
MTEKELCNFEGKEIKVICSNGRVLSGFCVYFTQALDNEPEIASITVNNHLGFTEIYQNEIETIEIITK